MAFVGQAYAGESVGLQECDGGRSACNFEWLRLCVSHERRGVSRQRRCRRLAPKRSAISMVAVLRIGWVLAIVCAT
jgi:hypothetical protein